MGRPALTPATLRAVALAISLWTMGATASAAEPPLPVQRPLAEGTVDWTNGRVEAQGVASPRVISPHTDWIEGDLRKQADERSLRNLRDTVAAVPFDSARTAGEVLGDAKLQQLAEGAKESFRETLTDGTALRRVWLPLDLVRLALGIGQAPEAAAALPTPGTPKAAAKVQSPETEGVVLVVEARGSGLNPAFQMRLLDASEMAVWHGEAHYISQRPRSLRRAPLLKLSGARGAHAADALLDKASHDKVHRLDGPIVGVWVVTDSWIKQ